MLERVEKLERSILSLGVDIAEVKGRLTALDSKQAETITRLIESHDKAMERQAGSLGVGMLKDVLMPLMFKVFTFFAALVIVLVSAILGIKWAIGDVTKGFV